MKKFFSFILVFSVMVTVVGCGEKTPNVPVKEIMTNIDKESDIVSGLMELDLTKADLNDFEKQTIEYFGINLDDIEEGIMKTPMINLSVDSVILLKAKDSSKLPELKTVFENYIEAQKTAFENYVPANLEIIEKHIIKEKGNYIILIISHDAEKIEKAFDNSFSK